MNKAELKAYKDMLLQTKSQILNGGILTSSEGLHISPDDLADEADLASNVISQEVSFNMRQRELVKLRAIEEALYRLDDGSYGCCEECGEEIGAKRLEKQPWATLCITHAEEEERTNNQFLKLG